MFQYAFARSFIERHPKVYLDLNFLETNTIIKEHFTPRCYELGIFSGIKVKRASSFQIALTTSERKIFKVLRFILSIKPLIIQQVGTQNIEIVDTSKAKFIYLDGYFQSENYFKRIRPTILEDFQFPQLDSENERIREKIDGLPDAVSLHVRRGDYLMSTGVLDVHGVMSLEYYEKAVETIARHCPQLEIFIFSDDLNWCKENLTQLKYPLHFIEQREKQGAWKDLHLMSCCKHHIIANSSFSWWGAWLSKRTGITIAPRNWFNPLKIKFEIRELIPENWIIIDAD